MYCSFLFFHNLCVQCNKLKDTNKPQTAKSLKNEWTYERITHCANLRKSSNSDPIVRAMSCSCLSSSSNLKVFTRDIVCLRHSKQAPLFSLRRKRKGRLKEKMMLFHSTVTHFQGSSSFFLIVPEVILNKPPNFGVETRKKWRSNWEEIFGFQCKSVERDR